MRRATYRYSGFERRNAVLAIEERAQTEPQEAYFAAQRLLARHGVAVGADLMLIIDPPRAGPELIERYCESDAIVAIGATTPAPCDWAG